jgi:uncharacterized protein YaaQ
MLLIVAIVQGEDAPLLGTKLVEQGLRLTQISSGGGILGPGNVAFLLGIEDEQNDMVLATIHAACHTRLKNIYPWAGPEPFYFSSMPVEVEVGGAVVFGVPVQRFAHLAGTDDSPAAAGNEPTEATSTPQPAPDVVQLINEVGGSMKLMVAIVQADDADSVVGTLIEAGHRLTRINTTGGFWRRGNATLLIGVKDEQVDQVLNLMQAACRRRSEAAPIEKGLPAYAANVFVLDASRFVRM